MRKLPFLLLITLAGCNSTDGSQTEKFVPARPVGDILYDTVAGTIEGAWAAVQTPLEDIGIKQQPIPEKLQQISDNPYIIPARTLCESIRGEIAELDVILGPDIAIKGKAVPGNMVESGQGEYIEQGIGFARDQAIGMVSNKVNILPFRGVIRNISGASRHSKEVERAYQAGKLRRAFLKGIAASLGEYCLKPEIVPLQLKAPNREL